MNQAMVQFRLYADGTVVHEDDFAKHDNALPFYDDFQLVEVPEAIIDYLSEAS